MINRSNGDRQITSEKLFEEKIMSSTKDLMSADLTKENLTLHQENLATSAGDVNSPLHTATGVYVTIHGHFYQPPRENPYLDTVERQTSAHPFHNWNERIHHECYRPNAFARILNDHGEIIKIVNNYEYLSFNIGPTLMSWLERYDMEVYQKIIEADRLSCQRLNGHGNAIAQVYNHIIMPLANERDKYTQVRWGKADFKHRFGREPEGLWLAETAVDYPTLEVLVNEGIKFIVLAPSQAERCRLIPTAENPQPEWLEVGGSQIDTTRPYRCYLQRENGEVNTEKYIDIFFYDGPISRDMGFNDVLNSSHHLVGRIGQAVRGDHRPAQLIAVATDGETFGHHKGGTEKCLAYAFTTEFAERNWTVTNFAHYLSIDPPTWQVELKPITAWSCSHGVDRWQADCGCGGGGGWQQQWRSPLRSSLNWLRDRLGEIYGEYGHHFFIDIWAARDEYVQVVLDRSEANISEFFRRHQSKELTDAERVDALRLLEMQRHTLLMFTSCGWFFDEISRPEGVQILRYAARAMELAADVAGVDLEKQFIKKLNAAPSNVEMFVTGDEVYRQLVETSQITLEQVAAHYAINSLFTNYTREQQIYCYNAKQLDYQIRRIGTVALAVGQLQLISEVTRECKEVIFAVLHLGGWDFHCCIQPFTGRRHYTEIKERLFDVLPQASVSRLMMTMVQLFGEQSFSLEDLFAEERQRLMTLLAQETLTRLDQLYSQVYRDNYSIIMAFHRDELTVPQELRVAAEVALGHRFVDTVKTLESESSNGLSISLLGELEAIASEAKHLRCHVSSDEAKAILERLIVRSVHDLINNTDPSLIDAETPSISRLINLGEKLQLGLSLSRAQEIYCQYLTNQIVPLCRVIQDLPTDQDFTATSIKDSENPTLEELVINQTWQVHHLKKLLLLGQDLAIDVRGVLETI